MLNDLAILFIEKDMIEYIDVETILMTLHLKILLENVLYEHLNIR